MNNYKDLLEEAILEIEYFHSKFKNTGTENLLISKINDFLNKEKEKLLSEIIIQDYPSKIKLAEARNPLYYYKGENKKKIPKKYQTSSYGWLPNKTKTRLYWCNLETKEPLLRNPKVAGEPRYFVINFQQLWNQGVHPNMRATISNMLKNILIPHFNKISVITQFPIKLEIFLFDYKMPVDVSNKGVIYIKTIEDILQKPLCIIPDDSSEYINDTGRCKWIKIDSGSPYMKIKIWKSDNEEN
jgi:hypothetical protein